MTDPEVLNDMLDHAHVTYLQITLAKVRYTLGVTRAQLAERMHVPVQRIHDFDERRVPWQSVTLSFAMKYARALGVHLSMGVLIQTNGADSGNTPERSY